MNNIMNISIFKNFTSREPVPGFLSGIADLMRSDAKLKTFTVSYRQTGSKTFKTECPLFAVACRFEGGKGRSNIRQLTGLSLVDFDHIVSSSTDFTPLPSPLKREKQFCLLNWGVFRQASQRADKLVLPASGGVRGGR